MESQRAIYTANMANILDESSEATHFSSRYDSTEPNPGMLFVRKMSGVFEEIANREGQICQGHADIL
jgi:hypothetical protein